MNIIDAVIIVLFMVGLLGGIRAGAIKSAVALIGTLLVFIVAFYLKDPVANFFYTYLPFWSFGSFKGMTVLNILFYEALAFVLVCAVLGIALRIILKITGWIEKILDATIILGIVSKLIGAVIGFLEAYVLIFILFFILNQPFLNIKGIHDSKIGTFMLNKTVILSPIIDDTIEVVDDIYHLNKNIKSISADTYNYESLDTLLEHKLISIKSVKKLQDKNKLKFNGLESLISKYGG